MRVLSRYRDARRTRILRIRLRLTVRVNENDGSDCACRTEEQLIQQEGATLFQIFRQPFQIQRLYNIQHCDQDDQAAESFLAGENLHPPSE